MRATDRSRRLIAVVLGWTWLGLSVAEAGVDSGAASARSPELRVYAAASLTEVVEALGREFGAARVVASFGASSDLARQLADGAPADVFVSASPDWIAFLGEREAIAGEPVLVARNALVAVAPEGSALAKAGRPGAVGRAADPRALLAALEPGDLVAIADEGVPAGDYARASVANLGLAAGYAPRLVGQKDVRAVLHAVEQGEVAAGFVYATDAKLARVETLFAFDPATHPAIEYPAAVLRQAEQPELARRFLDFLRADAARRRLSAAGFVLP